MLLEPVELQFAAAVRRLAYANPYDAAAQLAARRDAGECDVGLAAEEARLPPLGFNADSPTDPAADPVLDRICRRVEALLAALAPRLKSGAAEPSRLEREAYEDLVVAALYMRHFAALDPLPADREPEAVLALFRRYREYHARWTRVPFPLLEYLERPEHSFAVNYQHRLAVALLHTSIRGESRPAVRLRAAIWHSIFPREMRWYGVLLYERMHEVTTLILGPSGTGKELVAGAIGLARFVPFDAKRGRFTEPFAGAFHAINLSAMPRDLIESEMFGHAAGAFTGAAREREGWFEKCKRGHTVFLDELGELEEPVQVRLLRVLQSREFYRVGEAEPRRFEGRVIAATNRDLNRLIAEGAFREDLYFRLCSDVIRTPTLAEQLEDSPEELPQLIAHAAGRCLGAKGAPEFVEQLARETLDWIERSPAMGLGYAWPGNFRELEQCVRSVMVRGEYHPPARPMIAASAAATASTPTARPEASALDAFAADVRGGRLSFDELLERYCSLIASRCGSLAETARRLQKHRATIQSRIKPEWVERFGEG